MHVIRWESWLSRGCTTSYSTKKLPKCYFSTIFHNLYHILLKKNTEVQWPQWWVQSCPALQFLSVSDREQLSHCGELHHSPEAATGTKQGNSCSFKRDVFSTACEAAVRIIFYFFYPHLCCERKASANVLSWTVLPIDTAQKGHFWLYPPRVGQFHLG